MIARTNADVKGDCQVRFVRHRSATGKARYAQLRADRGCCIERISHFQCSACVADLDVDMRTRAQGTVAFFAILATCSAGIMNASWWAFVAGACALALISIANHAFAGSGAAANGRPASITLLAASILNASAISGAALGIGRIIGTAWGV